MTAAVQRMRILHVIPGLTAERGGPSTVLAALCQHQATAGHEVHVLSTDQGARSGETPITLPRTIHHKVCRVVGPDRVAYAPGLAAELAALLPRIDLVHAHSIFTYPIHVTLRTALRFGTPVILRPCGLLHPYSLQRSRGVKRWYLRLWGRRTRAACHAWHYTSKREADLSWPHDGSRSFVLPNGFEAPAAMDPRHARDLVAREWSGLGNCPYVLFLGRLHPKKRLDLLAEAFLAGAPSTWRLAVVGPDEEKVWQDLQQRFGPHPRWGDLVRINTVSGEKKTALLTAAGFFALPSEHENFGVAALEALALGTPLLLSPHVDLVEDLDAGDAVTVIPLETVQWQRRLAALLATPERHQATARDRAPGIRAQFSWARLTDDLLRYYQEIVASSPTRPTACGVASSGKQSGQSRRQPA